MQVGVVQRHGSALRRPACLYFQVCTFGFGRCWVTGCQTDMAGADKTGADHRSRDSLAFETVRSNVA